MSCSLPFSQASENNKQVILDILEKHLCQGDCVFEIAGGTGQHAEFFAPLLPILVWQSSDIAANVDSLNLRIGAAKMAKLPPALTLDVNQEKWNCPTCTAIFSANSLHIMSADSVRNFFLGAGETLQGNGLLLVYGPFKYNKEFTTASNARFDLWLKERDSRSGIRDFEWVVELASAAGFELVEDNSMPANNQLLVWKKTLG